ncbi:queuine tRNA-ribosyltransferase [Candidatus Protochlamydia naegleriophila]|uniref:Queuine tRNA-ribosyltransferase n=1 Tax=Candidatus Protochlamydia naegleriophila TaxID=389348 RepID=A0A0U5JF92_9BACT|nr:tRNA guanosine(34) transglycosylase Tgt [Candidatus Protochlamydia naegleriophila]CUI17055.1 queuine tRNA-ribosyltransferase [Candidatus Protochlamydia naegleriophila]
MKSFHFELIHRSKRSRARVGRIHTPHGIIDTPNFVAVGTNGTVKALDNSMLHDIGLQLMFCNTYHLLLQPGTETVRQAGGLHQFIHRKLPIITDSGGFQVFSLAYGGVADELKSRGTKKQGGCVLKITEEGVLFRSYRDGSKVLLTPESSIKAQKDLGADIIIPFDELPPYHIAPEALKKSLARTHRWEQRSLEAHLKNPQQQAMYAVIHGGVDPELRQASCSFLTGLPFDGFAIGGSMGKTKDEMHTLLSHTLPLLPQEKPNHLLGIGDLPSIDRSIPLGIDTFDSSYPTRAARHGILLTSQGGLNITKSEYAKNFSPIEKDCGCPACAKFTLAYIHHLFKARELTSMSLATIHNLYFMVQLMQKYREDIMEDKV